MNTALILIGGTGLGAGLMYLMDPDKGARRRTRLGGSMSTAAEALQATSRDVADRGLALAGDLRDADVIGRARALAGELRGADMAGRARALGSMAPVRRLGAELSEVVRDPRSFRPRLQGGRLTLRKRSGMAGFVAGYGWVLAGVVAGVAAVAWTARRGAGRIEVRHSIDIDAPVERVFEFWSRFENLPQFMSHVREVRSLGAGRTHWVVSGPAGTPVEWEAVTTRLQANRMIAWRTVEGALVEHRGSVRFSRHGHRTRLHVTMSYRPLGGALGHGVAALFGADPKSVLVDDLARFRALMETPRPEAVGEGRPRR
ncbi:MAG: SRPBCC family protein [Candidatus Rokuibacteriota bacterium]